MTVTVPVKNGYAGIGDLVAWPSKRYGVRFGKVSKITVSQGYNREKLSVSIQPVAENGYYSPVPVKKMSRVILVRVVMESQKAA